MGSIRRNSQSESHNNDGVKHYLQALLGDKVARNYPVVDFIQSVWGFGKNDLKEPRGGYKLPEKHVDGYMGNKYIKHGKEHAAYPHLKNLLESITTQVRRAMRATHPGTDIHIVSMNDKKVLGHFAEFKPDFIWSWILAGLVQRWLVTGIIGELKKKMTKKIAYSAPIDLSRIPEVRAAIMTREVDVFLIDVRFWDS